MFKYFPLLKIFFFFLSLPNFLGNNYFNFQDNRQNGSIGDSLLLEVSCYKKDILQENDLRFILSIKNLKKNTIFLPKHYEAVPGIGFAGNIGYEVIFCNEKDTINFTEKIVVNYDGKTVFAKTQSLGSQETALFQVCVNSIYFWKKGSYKIRFYLRKKSFRNIVSEDLYSDWVFINVLKDDVWPSSKEGSTPVMRQ